MGESSMYHLMSFEKCKHPCDPNLYKDRTLSSSESSLLHLPSQFLIPLPELTKVLIFSPSSSFACSRTSYKWWAVGLLRLNKMLLLFIPFHC